MSIPFRTHGTHIHVSRDPLPHLTVGYGNQTGHIHWQGQTTLPMFMKGGQDYREAQSLVRRFPGTFGNSGLSR